MRQIEPIELIPDVVERRTRQLAGAIAAADSGARIALLCGNSVDFVAARDAVTALGRSLVPINPKLAPPEIAYILEHSGATTVLVAPDLVDVARDAANGSELGTRLVELDHVVTGPLGPAPPPGAFGATTIYTSGTTGQPKGCVRTEVQEAARGHELIATYSLSSRDVHLIACPLAHSAPGILLRAGCAAGARTYIMERFDAESFLAAVARVCATFFFLVPTQYERLLALPEAVRRRHDVSSIRAALVAGAPIAGATKQRIVAWLGSGVLWEFYGSSETGTVAVLPPSEQLSRLGSVGRPAQNVELHLLGEGREPVSPGGIGEIFVRSPTVMSGYLDPATGEVSDAADRDGFVSVGDLGRLDDDGYLYLVDRKHDTIISGGVNVYPAEVERALAEHPSVRGAVCFGVPDDDWGQIVAATVALTAPDAASGAELRHFLRSRVAAFKIPKAIAFCDPDELPLGASGKPLRRKAAADLAPRLRRYDR